MGVRQCMEDVRRAIQVVDFIKGTHPVDRKMVLEWAASNDSDVVGATHKAMTAHANRIRGSIQSRDISRIVMRIFELGLRHPELRKAHRDASLWGDTVEEGILAILQQSGAVPRCCDEAPHRSPAGLR
jgi:hypothetical protein